MNLMRYGFVQRRKDELSIMITRYELVALSLFAVVLIASCSTIMGPPDSDEIFSTESPLSAYPYDTLVQDQPNLDLITIRNGLYIWNNGKDWHVRVAKPVSYPRNDPFNPVAEGRILAQNAKMIDIRLYNTTPGNFAKYGLNDIIFRFELRDTVEGFDFRLEPLGFEYCVSLDFQFNGITSPGLVHLGRTMHSPNVLPVPICFD
jgi:hypothetical protein